MVLSPNGAFSSTTVSASFSDGTDSPVSADSSLFKLTLRIRRASAGTKSPASRRIISPGTSIAASITFSSPSRITLAWGADILFNASRAFSALLSCITPIIAFIITMARISTGSKNSFGLPSMTAMANDTAAAISSMIIIASLNWSTKR